MTNEPQRISTADLAQAGPGTNGHEETSLESPTQDRVAPTDGVAPPTSVVQDPLLGDGQADALLQRWTDIQGQFVDSPRDSVELADALVAEVIQTLATSFAEERARLEGQWDGGAKVETEDLRVALQRYRSFFQRLLAA